MGLTQRSIALSISYLLPLTLIAQPTRHAPTPTVQTGGYFTTAQDLARLRSQATDPRLHDRYHLVELDATRITQKFEQLYPSQRPAPSTAALLDYGRNNPNRDTGYESLAIQSVLHPTPQNKHALRESLIADIGWRQRSNYWNGSGVHDGISTSNFLQAYDIATQLGVFTPADHAAIRTEMRQAGHFFEGWLLDNPFSRMYSDKREEAWCLNFHVAAASSLSWIAMLYPDFPESAGWLRQAEASLFEYLMNGYGEDGAYGEGSIHYWRISTQAILNFIVVSRNLGHTDYLTIPAFVDRLRNTLHWRLDFTAPNGTVFAVGDADRNSTAQMELRTAGTLLADPQSIWGASMIFDRQPTESFQEVSPLLLAHLDLSLHGTQPTHLSALYPFSGYASFRSAWDANADALFFKFGTSFIGRREIERGPVISGHAHQDALELELHYRGIPIVVDSGRHGPYETWASYGGFSKATISHSTIGLGNPWGYDRLDGQYAAHQKVHGPDFTYEQPQQNIGPADTTLRAFADLGHVAFSSARVRTYDTVYHQRSLIWFPDSSLTIVADHLDSNEEQPYEWYLTPVGNPIGDTKNLIFGDNLAKLQVLPILPANVRATTISHTTANTPPYYVTFTGQPPAHPPVERSSDFSLLILQQKAKSTDFLNVLTPFTGDQNPWTSETLAPATRRLTSLNQQITIAGPNQDGPLTTRGQCGVLSQLNGQDQTYALIEGTELARPGQSLIKSSLSTPVWASRFPPTLNALVSLQDNRASFELKPWPGDDSLLLNPPLAIPGKEPPALLLVSVSFHVNAKPQRMLILHTYGDLKLDDPAFDKLTNWPRDYHATVAKREPIAFQFDPATSMVTILLEPGEHQLVWQ